MTVPDEAVEAAARAIYESEGDLWRDGTEAARDFSRADARAALEAAALFIITRHGLNGRERFEA